MIVELDIFSGKPNPRWALDPATAGELRIIVGALPAASRISSDPPALGYRGFNFTFASESCRAYGGFVQAGQRILDDPKRVVELLLLAHLPRDFAFLEKRIEAELRR